MHLLEESHELRVQEGRVAELVAQEEAEGGRQGGVREDGAVQERRKRRLLRLQ